MSDGIQAATTLDAFSSRLAPPGQADADAVKFDGQDFRGDVLRPIAEGRTPPPAWWDAEHVRGDAAHGQLPRP